MLEEYSEQQRGFVHVSYRAKPNTDLFVTCVCHLYPRIQADILWAPPPLNPLPSLPLLFLSIFFFFLNKLKTTKRQNGQNVQSEYRNSKKIIW